MVLYDAAYEPSSCSPGTRIATPPRRFFFRDVTIFFWLGNLITWGMYALAIRGVQYFATTYQIVELQFEVQLVGVRYGVGKLEKFDLQ